jgi:large exoprotein involved in heme utilization and adhesion
MCLKANAARPDDPGDVVFLAANGDQKARVWSNPGAAKGLHLSGSDNNPKLTIDENGNLIIGGNANINSPGRMHISGEELLYLLNKSGVIVGKEWGGNGNLTVEGDLEISATMRSPGRMHIAGEELLYLLNKSGVIVGKEWGGSGDLTVENDLNVGNNISVNGDITLQNADVAEQFEVIDPMAAEPGEFFA